MLRVTAAAGAYLEGLLEAIEAPPNVAVRLVKWGRQAVAMRLDRPRASDASFAHQGRLVLLVERHSIGTALASLQLDVEELGAGPQLGLFHAAE